MNKIITNLKNNWILLIIILQPILDIVSYFQTEFLGSSYSWIIRLGLLFVVFAVSFIKSKNKKKLILYLIPFALFYLIHMVNLYRINTFNLIEDTKYFILVFQTPILCILLIDYIKSTNYDLNKIKNGILYSFIIIAVSIFLAYVTNTYQYTYNDIQKGITGWFSSANTASMILCAICPWALYMLSNKKKTLYFLIGAILITMLLYTNATRACYLTLLASLFVFSVILLFSKKENNKIIKILILSVLIVASILSYKFSFTLDRASNQEHVEQENKEIINDILETNDGEAQNYDTILKILKTSYLYEDLIEIHGEEKVVEVMRPYVYTANISDNRLLKIINAKIEFNDTDNLTKLLGIGYSRVAINSLDMENDLQAIFYYYGYLGISLYIIFILYFVLKAIIVFFKDFSLIYNKEYLILLFLIFLLVAGGEYSGAFLRKSNANIYLSLYLVLLYFNITLKAKKELNKNKISFLLLHLGFGGIETATLNTANSLSKKYNIELISFYNLKENQEKYINKNITIKYLYNGGPNKEEFINALKGKKFIKILKEGFKSVNILIKKKLLIAEEIINSDSFAIISTRYDFSTLLSKFGKKNVIKIAQEHHHHNNNKKYINILKNKYKKIDYLFALTPSLKKDYEQFLKNNKHTKIEVVPNMINSNKNIVDLNNKNIISVSRLDEGKKINELIDIFSQLKNKDTKLFIIGDGKEKENLKKQIKNLNLENRIIMTGFLDKTDQLKYWQTSSVYAMTSISEGLPMILLEAMSYGIPCIAYKTDSGVTDIIENGKNGFIIDNRNSDEYVKNLNTLLTDNILKFNMKEECIKKAKHFSESEIRKIWEEILK